MEQITISQNENQIINLYSNEPQIISLNNTNSQDVSINQNEIQDINIRNNESQILYIEGNGNIIGITDVLVNGISVVSDGIAYVTTPTKTSELINDSGFITNETDPTVPSYVKAISLADINNWNNKQDELVSGSTIKTINNESLLGSGNLEIGGNNYTAGTGISIDSENVISNTITSYNSLNDLPTIPTTTSELTNDSGFVTTNDLSTVAFTGSYDDLIDEPTVPTNTSELVNDSGYIDKNVNDLTYYTLSSNLSTVATTGNYNDLTNKPSIPTNTSDLSNDSGFISESNYASNLHGGTIKVGVNSYDINSVGQLYADTQTYITYGSMANTNFIGKGTLENVITGKGLIDNSVNNLTNYTNNTDLTNLFSNFLKVEEVTISIGSVSAQTGIYDQVYNLTVPSGYKLLGLVGYQFNGIGSASISLGRYFVRNTNEFVYSIYNTTTTGSSDSNTLLIIYVLYVKN